MKIILFEVTAHLNNGEECNEKQHICLGIFRIKILVQMCSRHIFEV